MSQFVERLARILLPLHVAIPVPPAPHEALVVGLGAPLVAAGEVEADAAAGEALRAVLGRALATLRGAVAVAVLALQPQAALRLPRAHDHDLNLKSSVLTFMKEATP